MFNFINRLQQLGIFKNLNCLNTFEEITFKLKTD